jgi:hypothetical protein
MAAVVGDMLPEYFICCNRVQYMKQMFHERQTLAPE